MMRRHDAVQAVVPQTQVQRELPHGPLILAEEAEIRRVLHHLERHRPDGDRLGHPVPEGVGPRAVDLVDVVVLAFAPEVVALQADRVLKHATR